MPVLSEEKRVLVAATARAAIEAIERAFEELGVRVGYLAPASLALFEGLAPSLAAAAAGDYALLHRSGGALSFFIGRGGAPIFFRQRPPEADEDQEREARLSLSYYAERLKGPGLRAVFVHDDAPGASSRPSPRFPSPRSRCRAGCSAPTRASTSAIAARPELLAGFAAVYGKS